jgi:gas vesicle protein
MQRKYLFVGVFVGIIAAVVFLAAGLIAQSAAADFRKISKEELRDMLDNPELVIIDVRTDKEWKKADLKIKGAAWEDADEVKTWAVRYPKDRTIALYCS